MVVDRSTLRLLIHAAYEPLVQYGRQESGNQISEVFKLPAPIEQGSAKDVLSRDKVAVPVELVAAAQQETIYQFQHFPSWQAARDLMMLGKEALFDPPAVNGLSPRVG
jgi:hypothetical protein